MRRSVSLTLALTLFAAGAAPAGAQTHVYLGAQALLLTGTHTDVAGAQHGVAAGAMLEFGVRGKRVGLRLEGIPPVSLPQKPSAFYGQATPQLSLIDGAVRFAVDPPVPLLARRRRNGHQSAHAASQSQPGREFAPCRRALGSGLSRSARRFAFHRGFRGRRAPSHRQRSL